MWPSTPPIILPVFLPQQGCPNLCIFCNQRAVVHEAPSPQGVYQFIGSSLSSLRVKKMQREIQVAFYGGSFTAMEPERQIAYLNTVRPFLLRGQIDSIRISTRPDRLNETNLSLVKEYGVKTIEVGAQSMINEILSLSQRGHTKEETLSALLRLKQWGFEVGVHLMVGLLGDTSEGFLYSLDQVISLRPHFIRIHPTLVLRGAPLEGLWLQGIYLPLSLEETVECLKKAIVRSEKASIPIARIGLQPSRDLEEYLLAGPYHPALHQLVESALFYEMAQRLLEGFLNGDRVTFLCHPKDLSNLRGIRNENLSKLKAQFYLREIWIEGREELTKGTLLLQTPSGEKKIDRASLDI